MSEKEMSNRFLGVLVAVLIVVALAMASIIHEPPMEYEAHNSTFAVSNASGYNVTVELYVVALEGDCHTNVSTNTTGGWDYIKFTAYIGEQVNATIRWTGNSNSVTVFSVYTIDYEDNAFTTVDRHVVNEDEGYIDLLVA